MIRSLGEIILPHQRVAFGDISALRNRLSFLLGNDEDFLVVSAAETNLPGTLLVHIATGKFHFKVAVSLGNGLGRKAEPIVDVFLYYRPDGIGRSGHRDLSSIAFPHHFRSGEGKFRNKQALVQRKRSLLVSGLETERSLAGAGRIVGLGRHLDQALSGINLGGR